MATRPGYIWSGTEWVSIGQEATVNPFAYQASAPITPATGDIWVDSDDTVPSIDSAQFLRWRKTVAGGETSLSGNDDTSLPLQYTAGYEQLYINGVLQVRTLDYTATTGTTITGLTALALNDVVEIFSVVARLVGDVYTQAQADARYYTQTQADAKYASQINFPTGEWTAFTPTWVGLTVGNGVYNRSHYVLIGKTCHVAIDFSLGTTSAVTGGIALTLPLILARKSIKNTGVLYGLFVDTGSANYTGSPMVAGESTREYLIRHAAVSGANVVPSNVSAATPFTFGSTDRIIFATTFETA